jgi:hypothetical protein
MAENEDTSTLTTFFEGLTKTLGDAIAASAPKGGEGDEDVDKAGPAFGSKEWQAKYHKSVEDITSRLDAFEKSITSEDPTSLRSLIKGYVETAEATRDALSQTMDNVAKLAGAGAVRKSIEGDDTGGPGDDKVTDPKTVQKAGETALHRAVTELFRKPAGSKLTIG